MPPCCFHVRSEARDASDERALSSLGARHAGGSAPVDADGFRNALYLIDIGQNDLSAAFGSGAPYDDIIHLKIPAFISEIKDAIMVQIKENCHARSIGLVLFFLSSSCVLV